MRVHPVIPLHIIKALLGYILRAALSIDIYFPIFLHHFPSVTQNQRTIKKKRSPVDPKRLSFFYHPGNSLDQQQLRICRAVVSLIRSLEIYIRHMVYKSAKSFQLNLYNSFILIQQFLLFFHRQLSFPERTRDARSLSRHSSKSQASLDIDSLLTQKSPSRIDCFYLI